MKTAFICLVQWVWGFAQNLVGFLLFLAFLRNPHAVFHTAVLTEWKYSRCVSLGMFIFVTGECDLRVQGFTAKQGEDIHRRLAVHEYGHTLQSLVLGPLYIPVILLPSMLWAGLPCCTAMRTGTGRSYYDFYTESWANRWGERGTGEASMER